MREGEAKIAAGSWRRPVAGMPTVQCLAIGITIAILDWDQKLYLPVVNLALLVMLKVALPGGTRVVFTRNPLQFQPGISST